MKKNTLDFSDPMIQWSRMRGIQESVKYNLRDLDRGADKLIVPELPKKKGLGYFATKAEKAAEGQRGKQRRNSEVRRKWEVNVDAIMAMTDEEVDIIENSEMVTEWRRRWAEKREAKRAQLDGSGSTSEGLPPGSGALGAGGEGASPTETAAPGAPTPTRTYSKDASPGAGNKDREADRDFVQDKEKRDSAAREVNRLETLGSLEQRDKLLKKHSGYIDHFLPPRFEDPIMGDQHWIETLSIGIRPEDYEDWLKLMVSNHRRQCGLDYDGDAMQHLAAESERNHLPSTLEIANEHRDKVESQKTAMANHADRKKWLPIRTRPIEGLHHGVDRGDEYKDTMDLDD